MSRPGGESGKLGDRYEAIWTADNLLDLVTGFAVAITVEPFGKDALGIEFIKELPDGTHEHHSAKRQTTGATWTAYDLVTVGKTGRSILQDLFEKQKVGGTQKAVFVSATTANELNELCDRARRSVNAGEFGKHIATSKILQTAFTKYIEPLCKKLATDPFDMLKRMRVVGITEPELIRQTEAKILLLFYRPDGSDVDATALRLVLGEIVNDRLGQRLDKNTIVSAIQRYGFEQRDWTHSAHIREQVERLNQNYTRHVEGELIGDAQIPRGEATKAFDELKTKTGARFVAIIGPAGNGKSCTLAQTLVMLNAANLPFLSVRLDIQTDVLTSTALGKELGLPISPPGVLAGIANGAHSVLVIDQLDALSFASGRNPHLWDVFEELLWEVERYPNMRLLMACRGFDAENDPRLRRLLVNNPRTSRIDLAPLERKLVIEIVSKTGIDPRSLGEREIELLRTPLHLNLYLQGDPGAHGSFHSVQELYRRYWNRKQSLVDQRLGRTSKWNGVIESLAGWLSDRQTLSAPEDVLDAYAADAQVMASEHVLVFENRRYRFFHEGFFDYAFARGFVQRGEPLIEWLIQTEQHLFRRAQVRQILAYQRDREKNDYLRDLRNLLTNSRVRYHLKKLVLQWLRQLDDPMPEEWAIVESLWNT